MTTKSKPVPTMKLSGQVLPFQRFATEKLCPYHEGESNEIARILRGTEEPWEVEVRRLEPEGKRIFHQAILASGSGQFPIDMLRYDSCYPLTVLDADLIVKTFQGWSRWEIRIGRSYAHQGRTSVPRWTAARWTSFGVRITEIDIEV